MIVELKISNFGRLIGRETNGIAEFLNVPFGVINARFKDSTLFEGDNATYDCLHQGPLCPQTKPFDDDYAGVPIDECAPLDLHYDELRCLNLRLQLPVSCLNSDRDAGRSTEPIPTVIWLHGGSNIAGTPYRGSSNSQRWLERAVAMGKPFAIVTPHYRVGFFGWLPVGDTYNQAIGDQRVAIEWVRKFGHAWGCDNAKISIIGQSAGASDAFAHLCDSRSYDQVSQIAMLSGLIGSSAFPTFDDYEQLTQKLRSYLGCDPSDASVDQLVKAQVDLGISFFGAIKPAGFDFDKPWKALDKVRVIVSDCIRDAYFMNEDPSAQALWSAVNEIGEIENESVGDFFTRIIFRNGANELWSKSEHIFRQLCDSINPYNPSLGNMHMVELHYIINGYRTLPEFDSAVAKCQEIWVQLIHLQDPWDPTTQVYYMYGQGHQEFIDKNKAWNLRGGKIPKACKFPRLINLLRGF